MLATPVPANDTVLGLPTALWAMLSAPERTLAAAGVNVMAMVQLAATANVIVAEQVPPVAVIANSLLLMVNADSCNGDTPVFLTVTVCAGLVVPTVTWPKPRMVEESVAMGAVFV